MAASLPARLFGMDPRALGVLRIGLGFLLLLDLWMRVGLLEALYTDRGVFPRALLEPWMRETVAPFHQLGGSYAYQAALFALAAVAAGFLLIGRFTRIAAVTSWLLLVSAQSRQPIVLNFGDDVLRMALFWALFLPLDLRFSLDARRRGGAAPVAPIASIGTLGFCVQIASVYFFSALYKSGDDWHVTGLALYYALQMDAWVTPIGVWLRQYVTLTRVLTFATFGLELVGPFLLFAPIWWLRAAVALGFVSLHLGIAASYTLGIFPWVDVVVLLPFLPREVWDFLERRLGRAAGAGAAPAAAPAWRPARWAEALAAVALVYVTAHNVDGVRSFGLPKALTSVGHHLRINQKWLMFTPDAPRFDGWWVIPGTLADGRQVDLSPHGPALTWQKPERISADNRPFRYAIYLWQIMDPRNGALRQRWVQWQCAMWNRTHPPAERLRRIEMYFFFERTLDIGQGVALEKQSLGSAECPDPLATPS